MSDSTITVTILDTVTNERATSSDWTYEWWAWGNGSCDCNRALAIRPDNTDTGTCLGCHRYLIIEASSGSLQELNADYPQVLLEQVGICPASGSQLAR